MLTRLSATLPPSSHLSILLNILQSHPTLIPDVVKSLPQPDLDECIHQLDKIVGRIQRKAGSVNSGLDQSRAWARAQDDVSEFCRTASTYVSFFTSPPSKASQPLDPQTLQTLLYIITSNVYSLLHLVPPGIQIGTPSVKSLLDLGILIVKSWIDWVAGISVEVNQNGGMYPRSLVEGWATNLDAVAQYRSLTTVVPTSYENVPLATSPLVESLQSALAPIFDKFIAEVGWLIGRNVAYQGSSPHSANSFPQHAFSWSQGRAVNPGRGYGVVDEEL